MFNSYVSHYQRVCQKLIGAGWEGHNGWIRSGWDRIGAQKLVQFPGLRIPELGATMKTAHPITSHPSNQPSIRERGPFNKWCKKWAYHDHGIPNFIQFQKPYWNLMLKKTTGSLGCHRSRWSFFSWVVQPRWRQHVSDSLFDRCDAIGRPGHDGTQGTHGTLTGGLEQG